MPTRRKFVWLATAAAFGLIAVWLGHSWAMDSLWESAETGHHQFCGFTSDGRVLITFGVNGMGENQPKTLRAVRHDARTGRVLGETIFKTDKLQLDSCYLMLLNDITLWYRTYQRDGTGFLVSLFDIDSGERISGPIPTHNDSLFATDPQGRWFAEMAVGRDSFRIVSFRDGKVMHELNRPGFVGREVLLHDHGDRMTIRWACRENGSELVELREVSSGRCLAEAPLAFGRPHQIGIVIADRVFHLNNGVAKTISFDLSKDSFGSERAEPIWDRERAIISHCVDSNYLMSKRYRTAASWQLTINNWLNKLGVSNMFASISNDGIIAAVDIRTGETLSEFRASGIGHALSNNAELIAATNSRGQIVVFEVRRSPERWAYVWGMSTAIGVLLLACWRSRRRQNPAAC